MLSIHAVAAVHSSPPVLFSGHAQGFMPLCLSHSVSSLGIPFLGMSRSDPASMVQLHATKKTSPTFPLPWKEFLLILSLVALCTFPRAP